MPSYLQRTMKKMEPGTAVGVEYAKWAVLCLNTAWRLQAPNCGEFWRGNSSEQNSVLKLPITIAEHAKRGFTIVNGEYVGMTPKIRRSLLLCDWSEF